MAIVDAARALATEHGADGFTVEGVARAAGVSRRTVFNHFATVDDLLVAVCEQILAEASTALLEQVDHGTAALPDGEAGGRAALDAVGEAAREVDLATAIVTIHRMLGCPEPDDERAQSSPAPPSATSAARCASGCTPAPPGLDPVDLELGLALLFAGITTIAGLWLEAHPDLDLDVSSKARADWDRLLDRVLHRLRTGTAG